MSLASWLKKNLILKSMLSLKLARLFIVNVKRKVKTATRLGGKLVKALIFCPQIDYNLFLRQSTFFRIINKYAFKINHRWIHQRCNFFSMSAGVGIPDRLTICRVLLARRTEKDTELVQGTVSCRYRQKR